MPAGWCSLSAQGYRHCWELMSCSELPSGLLSPLLYLNPEMEKQFEKEKKIGRAQKYCYSYYKYTHTVYYNRTFTPCPSLISQSCGSRVMHGIMQIQVNSLLYTSTLRRKKKHLIVCLIVWFEYFRNFCSIGIWTTDSEQQFWRWKHPC